MSWLVDTHCHLASFDLPKGIIAAANTKKVRIVAVTETPDEYRRLRARLGPAANVDVALGLHPGSAAALDRNQLTRFFRMLPEADWVGEVGLDFRRETTPRDRRSQRVAFESILGHAQINSKTMTVHSRGAVTDVVECLEQVSVRAILHWFTGSLRVAEQALSIGAYFSINPAMMVSERGRALLRFLPRDRVLVESDGPYCRVEGQAVTPASLRELVGKMAAEWGASVSDVDEVLDQNLRRLRVDSPAA